MAMVAWARMMEKQQVRGWSPENLLMGWIWEVTEREESRAIPRFLSEELGE